MKRNLVVSERDSPGVAGVNGGGGLTGGRRATLAPFCKSLAPVTNKTQGGALQGYSVGVSAHVSQRLFVGCCRQVFFPSSFNAA